jgi:hypothetical protein
LEPAVHYDADEGKLNIDVALSADRDIPPCSKDSPVSLVMDVRDAMGRTVGAETQAGAGLHGQVKAEVFPESPHDVLYAPVHSDGLESLQVEVSVDNYPRAFLFEVGRNKAESQRDKWRVRITKPSHVPMSCTKPLKKLPVSFQVDAPEDSFFPRGEQGRPDDKVLLEIFDEQRPDASQSDTVYSDRKVTVELEEADKPGEMKAMTTVEDFSTELEAHGLENVVARVRAQILRDRQPKHEDFVRVIFDGRPPEFALEPDANRVVKGKDIRVTATIVHTLSEMAKLEYGFKGDGENQFSDKSKPADIHGNTATFSMPTKELDAREYTILVRGENKAGNFDFQKVKVEVVEPPPPVVPGKPAAPATVTIRGTVKWLDGSPAPGVEVTMEQPARSAKTDGAGKFSFEDLPPGPYTLKAKGSTGGMHAAGEAKADASNGDVNDVKISLSSLNR